MHSVDIRPATPTDALCLHALATQVFLDTYAPSGIRPVIAREVMVEHSEAAYVALLVDPAYRVLVAEHDHHMVAFAVVALRRTHDLVVERKAAELLRLYVQSPFVRQAIGTALLEAAESEAREDGAQVLWLTAWEENARALRFYARRGYRELGSVPFVFEDEHFENRLFVRSLAG
jgi:diamine N-acetyltransferase